MTHVTYSAFRAGLAGHLTRVCADRTALTVTRQRGDAVVVLSESEYEGLLETVHLLKSPRNAQVLLEAMAELDAGRGVEHDPTS